MILDSDALKLIQDVYDDLCREIAARRGVSPEDATRALMAIRLLNCAASGERRREKLMAYARAFAS
jgi:hypothetical protein